MQHPEEGVIHAWLDGELSADEAEMLETHIADCSECAAAVAEARGLIAASSRIVSALDTVPGDVIPATIPRRRAWYANGQIRAAAAIVLVAGASLVVMRREREPDTEQLMSRAASAPAAVDSGSQRLQAMSEDAAAEPVAPPRTQPTVALKAPAKASAPRQAANAQKERASVNRMADIAAEKSMKVADNAAPPKDASRDGVLQGKVAGAEVSAQSPPPANAVTSEAQRSQMARLRAAPTLDNVIVTGVVASTGAGEVMLREMRSDTTGNIVMTVYEVSPGVQVTLVESAPQAFVTQQREADARKTTKSGTPNSTIAQASPAPPSTARIESVTWTNPATGRSYKLTGSLSKDQLTVLRKRLPPAKR